MSHPPEWGWKVVKCRFMLGLSPGEIVARFAAKHRSIGATYVKAKIRNYRQMGNPNARSEAVSRHGAFLRFFVGCAKSFCASITPFNDRKALDSATAKIPAVAARSLLVPTAAGAEKRG